MSCSPDSLSKRDDGSRLLLRSRSESLLSYRISSGTEGLSKPIPTLLVDPGGSCRPDSPGGSRRGRFVKSSDLLRNVRSL